MDKQNVYLYDRILFDNEKKQSCNMDGPQKIMKVYKAKQKDHLLYYYFYMKCPQ